MVVLKGFCNICTHRSSHCSTFRSRNLLVSQPLSALTLQEPNDSSLGELPHTFEESIAASPPDVAHNTIDGSSNTSPFTREKLLAGAAESSSVLALQDKEVSSSEDDATSSEESITVAPGTHNLIDGSPPSASSHMSKILMRSPLNWHQVYFIRMDRSSYFHMYPDLGGPFKSVDEAEGAINRHLELHYQAMYGFLTLFQVIIFSLHAFMIKQPTFKQNLYPQPF